MARPRSQISLFGLCTHTTKLRHCAGVQGLDNEGGDDDAYNDEMTCVMAMMVFQQNTIRPILNRCRNDESKSSIKLLQFHNLENANIKFKFRKSKNAKN